MRLPPILLLLLLLLSCFAKGQDSSCIDVGRIVLSKNISEIVQSAYIDAEEDVMAAYGRPGLFTPGIGYERRIPPEVVPKKAILRFDLCNRADTAVTTCFFPGFYYRSINLYRVEGTRLVRLPSILPENPDSLGYRLLTIPPGDSSTYVAELRFVKTYINTVRPRFINPNYLPGFRAELQSTNNLNDVVTYLFCGLLLMMVLYSIANFLQGSNPDFLYYSLYAFFIGIMLFTKAVFTFHTTQLSYFLESYFDFILQSLGIIFYMVFMQRYLETRKHHPFLFNLYRIGIRMLILAMIGYTILHYTSNDFLVENAIENVSKTLLLLVATIFVIYGIRHRYDRQFMYLFQGNFLLFIFGLFSMLIILGVIGGLPGILSSSLFYYEIGIFLELVFFLMALNYKNRRQLIAQARERERLKAENLMKEYEKDLAVLKAQQQERERISADMHDELGSGMTAIRLMSEIAKRKMEECPPEIERISQSADEVLNKMNAIIWSMNIGNDTLGNLISYIRSYAIEFFENTPITCRVNIPPDFPEGELTGEKRRNIFLSVKETLTNALKHSRADLITIDFIINHELCIRITDNGIGIDMKNLRQFGNGLKNISRRMESIGGSYRIFNSNGTVSELRIN